MTRVIIVDDQHTIREFLKINLANQLDIQVVGLADSGSAAIAQIKEHQPDIVLMDIEMPGELDGIAATEIITQEHPGIKILLFTSQDNRQQLDLALKAGARGYVLKNSNVKDIADIIRLTEKGFFQIGPLVGNWSKSPSEESSSDIEAVTHEIATIIPQSAEAQLDSTHSSQINQVLSNLTTGMSQLQKAIQSQENTIVDLTNQYAKVQQEIRTKLLTDNLNKGPWETVRGLNYKSRSISKYLSQSRQNILFISSFFLGVFTVLVLMFLIMTLGSVL
ncbi:response regulator transcription factor [Pleurocapsa sp. PCC 7319]|uniref:response regulator n=1 Tax=Pleurocapsa sp. PCC 7319 TaxID=118161 RepID=UPI001181A6EA|nr:response regulator transcription factor [Pleurocapsa sp. PCC 7319]